MDIIQIVNTETGNMKWKLLHWLFLLLCDPLAAVTAGNEILETPVTRQHVEGPLRVLSFLPASVPNESGSQGVQGVEVFYTVNLPPLECSTDYDCLERDDDWICSEGQCTCRPPSCWVYKYVVTGLFTAKNVFTCGKCGVLGSSCNATVECDYPGDCWSDGFCHCQRGENYDGVCVTSDLSWSSTLALSAMGIIIFFAICVFAVNCFQEPPWRNPEAWRCMCCSGGDQTQRRRGGCEKSPAFTIQTHYASQDLAAGPNDPAEVVPGGLGGAVPRRSRSHSFEDCSTVSSISSAVTNLTTVSDSAESTDRTPSPPPHYLNSREETSESVGTDMSSIQLKEISHEAITLPASSSISSENTESVIASTSGSCTHERCQFCLPKPHASPPRTNAAMKARPYSTDQPLLLLRNLPQAEGAVQFTQL